MNRGKRIQVRSMHDHTCWEGTPFEFTNLQPFQCQEFGCGQTFESHSELCRHAKVRGQQSPQERELDLLDARKRLL